MKKSVIVFSLAVICLGLLAFQPLKIENSKPAPGCIAMGADYNMILEIEKEAPEFSYKVSPRFQPITKSQLKQAATAADFIAKDHLQPLLNYEWVEIVVIENDRQTDKRLQNNFYKLSEAQKSMLHKMDYSQHFLVRTHFKQEDTETGEVEYKRAEPHYTVVPEKQAAYEFGEKELIDYITEENQKNTVNINADDLRFTLVYFTVTKAGKLTNIHVDRASNYELMDKALIEIIGNLPGQWLPAENDLGKKVEQELVLTFGGPGGC